MCFFSSRRRHTRSKRDWSSDVCSSDLRSIARAWEMMLKTLLCAARDCGINIISHARAIDLLTTADGTVCGVRGFHNGHVGRWLEIGRASCRERGERGRGGAAGKEHEER